MKKYHSPREYQDAAKSPDTLPEELQNLIHCEYDFVWTAVAKNPNVTPEILTELVSTEFDSWTTRELAAVLAASDKLSASALDLLADRLAPLMNKGRDNEMGFRAGINICDNPKTPFESITRALNRPTTSTQIRKAIARETCRKDVLEFLLTDRSQAVRKLAETSLRKFEKEGTDTEAIK